MKRQDDRYLTCNKTWPQNISEACYQKLGSGKDSLVVDPFLGSGEFAIPAIQLGR